jgi:hypothetical protein
MMQGVRGLGFAFGLAEFTLQRRLHVRRHEALDIAAQTRDLLDDP